MEEKAVEIEKELMNYYDDIEEFFEKLEDNGIQEDVECLDFEINLDPEGDLALTVFSTDGYDEVFKNKDNQYDEFAGSEILIKGMDLRKFNLDDISDDDYSDLCDRIFECLKNILEEYMTKIDIPICLKYHDSTLKYNMLSEQWEETF